MSKPVRTNKAYKVDSWAELVVLVFRACRWVVRQLVRYRTEAALLGLFLFSYSEIDGQIGPDLAGLVVLVGLVLVGVWGWLRRLILGRLRCSRTRRQLVAVFAETRVNNDAGKSPLVLRSRITPAGERYSLMLRIGQSTELLEGRQEEIRAAARCRDVRLTRDRNRAHRVTVEVIRRDTLDGILITTPLVKYAAGLDAHALGVDS